MTEIAHALLRFPGRGWLRRALTLSPGAAHVIRFSVAAAVAVWIGKAPGLVENQGYWILLTVLIVMQPTTGGSLVRGLLRLVGTLAGAMTAILLFRLFAQHPPLLMAAMFLVQAIAAYGNSGPRFQYAWFVWALTSAIVLGEALAGQSAVETVAFQRASMLGIGIVLIFVVDSLLWPARAEPQLRQSLASRARSLGQALRRAIAPPGAADSAPTSESGVLAGQLGLVDAVRSELGVSGATADALARLAMLLETLASRARVLAGRIEHTPELALESRALDAALRELARQIEAGLEEIADALTASRPPVRLWDDLERALLAVEAERDPWVQRSGRRAPLEGHAADIRDLVAVLRTAEDALSPIERSRPPATSGSQLQFSPDPLRLRLKIALRTGTAVIAAFVIPLALGWPVNTLVAPVAFMFCAFNRGAGVLALAMLSAILGLGWLVADLSLVYVAPHVGRAPLALVIPFGVTATFALIAARRPQLALLPSVGGLIALLPVFGGTSAPTDVYGPYSTVSYMAIAVGIGWLFSRLMWPATAAGLFRQRVALQLELCLDAVPGSPESDGIERRRRAANLIRGCTRQTVQLGPLHRQALHEPVERALDEARRVEILPLALDLMDAVLGYRPADSVPLLERGGAPLRPLLEALLRAERALLERMQSAVDVLRGEAAYTPSDLAEAQRVFEDRLFELSSSPVDISDLTDEEKRHLLVQLDRGHRLVARQLTIEDWLAGWHEAERLQT